MKLKCPRCSKTKIYSTEQIMGFWVICKVCHRIFPWKDPERFMTKSTERVLEVDGYTDNQSK